jgi:predicted nucleic acid-binding protein
MMAFLIDTNILAELRKSANGSPAVQAWQVSELMSQDAYLSVLTVGEIRKGIELIGKRDSTQAAALESWLQLLYLEFSDRILPLNLEIAEDWGHLNVNRPLPVIDSMLAATARVHGLVLATRNVKDLYGVPLRIVNPFAFGSDAYEAIGD